MSQAAKTKNLQVELENIGGINEASMGIPPGVTVLSGRNATNRTSFLQGIMAAMGSEADQITVKSDAEEGRAVVQTPEETYSRTLTRTNGGTALTGDPFTDDPELVDLYAFLLKENPVRQTVEQDGDLYDVLMRPVDTAEIENRLERLKTERERLKQQLDNIEQRKKELPQLEERKQELESRLEELRADESTLQQRKEELEEQFTEQGTDEQSEEIEELEEQLKSKRTDISTLERSIEQQERLHEAAIDELESIDKPDTSEKELRSKKTKLTESRDILSEQIETLRAQQQEVTSGMEAARALQDSTASLKQVVSDLDVDITIPDGPLTTSEDKETGEITDALVQGDTIRCLACGSEVTTDTVEAVIDQYREINTTFRDQIHELEQEQKEIRKQIKETKSQLNEWKSAEERIAEATQQKQEAKVEIKKSKEELETVKQRVTELESEFEEKRQEMTESSEDTEVREEHSDIEDQLINTEVEIRKTTDEIRETTGRIEEIKEEISDEGNLETDLDNLKEEITGLRSRVEDIERELVEEFNETIETVLDILSYENIERIWIERKQETVKVGRRKEEQTVFELNIVREGSDGVYPDELRHLSESERSVTGLVVALTGYIVHDVDTKCPIMVLDSVEMIDSERIAKMIEHFRDETPYLVAALLPEDSAAVEESLPEATVRGIDTLVS